MTVRPTLTREDVGGLDPPGGGQFCERQVGGASLALDLQPAPHQRRGTVLATPPRPPLLTNLTSPLPLARTPCGVPGLLGLDTGGGAATFGEPDLSHVGVGRGAQHPVADLPAEQHGGLGIGEQQLIQAPARGMLDHPHELCRGRRPHRQAPSECRLDPLRSLGEI
ncbi:hypothetical protein [Streptomyces sp. NPDC004528]|uniref:hypothetical protein n=1 Tax=Streptomyces sp. NPDC004528 TaxID=3154550 RepID=UPI0033B48F69